MAIQILITHIVIRTIGLRHIHPVGNIVLGLPKTLHAHQTVNGIDLLLSGIASFIVGKVFIVLYIILLVVREIIRIRTSRSQRIIQHIQTENRTRGVMVFVFITKSIQCLTWLCFSITVTIGYFTKRFIETDQRSIDVRIRAVASRDIQPIHFTIRQT